MVAANNRIGRPRGARTKRAPVAHGVCVPGSATSAAKLNRRPGVADQSSLWVYIPGEGFVRWAEIEAQVAAAYEQWRKKKALQGVHVMDGWEWRQVMIEDAIALREGAKLRSRGWVLAEQKRARLRAEVEHLAIDAAEAREMGVWVEEAA